MHEPFSIRARCRSMGHALHGLKILLAEHNCRIHAVATLLVVCAAIALPVRPQEGLWLVLAILLVWMAEAFNTALEYLADAVSTETHPLIGQAKDVAAAAVLLAALLAVVIGAWVFVPYGYHWWVVQ